MRIWSARHKGRPVPRAGAALVVLLAVLVHLLACAHGSAPVGAGRADALLVVSTASCGQPAVPDDDHSTVKGLDPAQGGGGHCRNLDEPTAQPPRDITLAAGVHSLLPAEHVDALRGPLGQQPPRYPASAPPSVQQERARLGVWRT
ncbi:hypothetical protein [Streptomyces sp. NPDC001315]|uniref:hypothetical protein n=1 Tax=Streptomyces sp. NPDC001315 TaxID=3364562 RepID=UPI00367F5746